MKDYASLLGGELTRRAQPTWVGSYWQSVLDFDNGRKKFKGESENYVQGQMFVHYLWPGPLEDQIDK